ncbi:putative tRNA-dihydrouridine synthase 1 [[Clostridium] cellulosi]|uniref:tRNA-dihydrouridine synthase n=1 Tax=[Clostridium] cellulosi TaxID=29343 RepID=A0A078KJ63_9FIRM|nr:putative tRNA-dihydrouridine synthase 1 [[Clostridium] cellulosi]
MKIGNVDIKGYAALAPMAGVADTAFRTICRQFGACYVVGEMASAKGLCMSDRKTARLLSVTDAERPMAIQLFGNDPEVMAAAAVKSEEYGPDIIDINMGCPAPKIVSNGGGSALLKDPLLAGKIIESVVRAVKVPVTVKIRKGWDDAHVNAVEMAHIAEESGAAAITIHGRTREQMYRPYADLEIIRKVKEAVKIPVIGNGDVTSPESAKKMYDETGVDLVMVGRGALGAPWIFRQIEEYLSTGKVETNPDVKERMRVMVEHIKLLCSVMGEYPGIREARKHAAWYMKGLDGAASLREKAGRLAHIEDIERLAEEAIRLNT